MRKVKRRNSMNYIETDRLILRDWDKRDILPLIEMNKDEEVMRYFPSTIFDEESIALYNRINKEFEEFGYAPYAVEIKDTRQFIGFIGFHHATFQSTFTPCIEILWRLKKEYWNKGYATEGASACLKYGINNLHLDKIYSFTAKINIPSERVMKKIGMQKIGEFQHPNVDPISRLCKHVLYMR